MALPLLLPAISALAPAVSGLIGKAKKPILGAHRKRRRRRKLTHGDMLELTHIRNTLGRTAAAQALPFYLK